MYNIQTICVCGAGTMGSGITQVAARNGFNTIQFDVNETMLERSRAAITNDLQRQADKGKLSTEEMKATVGRIKFTSNPKECIAELIIEAIIENKEAKINLFNSLSTINQSQTIFATNTSSISVTEIANEVNHSQKVAGMHFFNPAPIMKLVEVIAAKQTSDEVVQTLVALSKRLGKIPVVCKDSPGFIVNRVARHYYLEAMKLVEMANGNMEEIDQLLVATGFKMGPFQLMDLIGMDINFGVSNIVWEALNKPERLRPSSLQREKVEKGELGRKTGKGFYKY